jgi:FlaA1/EpsC-like NDP-sugar epimerase
MFENKKLLITGGTGTFGNAVHRLRRLTQMNDGRKKAQEAQR